MILGQNKPIVLQAALSHLPQIPVQSPQLLGVADQAPGTQYAMMVPPWESHDMPSIDGEIMRWGSAMGGGGAPRFSNPSVRGNGGTGGGGRRVPQEMMDKATSNPTRNTGQTHAMHSFNATDRAFLEGKGINVSNRDVALIDRKISHFLRSSKGDKRPSNADVRHIDAAVQQAPVVLWDKSKGGMVYVYRDASGSPGRVAFNVNFNHNGQPIITPVNMQTSTRGKSDDFINSLRYQGQYELVRGNWKNFD